MAKPPNSVPSLSSVILALLLQSCVTSQFPLLGNKPLVVDPSLTGHYLLGAATDQKPLEYDVYLKGKQYLLVSGGKLAFIGTLHKADSGGYVAELRSRANSSNNAQPSPSSYTYMIVKKTGAQIQLNLLGCTLSDPCKVASVDQLEKLISDALQHPDEKQIQTATKTGELGQ